MSDKDYGFDLDDILREFGSDSDKPKAKPASQPKPKAAQPETGGTVPPCGASAETRGTDEACSAQQRRRLPAERQQPMQRPAQSVQQRPAAPQQKPAAPASGNAGQTPRPCSGGAQTRSGSSGSAREGEKRWNGLYNAGVHRSGVPVPRLGAQ